MSASQGSLTLDSFTGTKFEPDFFIVSLLQDHIHEKTGSSGKKEEFDPASMLELLRSRSAEVQDLKVEASSRVKGARELARKLGREHRESVRRLKVESEDALKEINLLEDRVASVGSKAVSIGQQIDKMDKQRRRAQEAEQAIHTYDAMRSSEDSIRTQAMASLIPGSSTKEERNTSWDEDAEHDEDEGSPTPSSPAALGRSSSLTNGKQRQPTVPESAFIEAAGMLRKLDSMARILRVDGSQRAVDGLSTVKERFEMALLSEFDSAREAWSKERTTDALDQMRRCARSLFSFNGGGSCIQRYVSTLPFCIDEGVIQRDEKGIANATSVSAVIEETDRVVNEIIQMLAEEEVTTAQIFPNHEKVCNGGTDVHSVYHACI
jgi:hypothetical protein